MEKRITTSVTYELPIENLDFVTEFISELDKRREYLQKSVHWKPFVTSLIDSGIKVVFLHLWNTKEQWFEGFHYDEEMVFEILIGFNHIGMDMLSLGDFMVKDIETLCKRYEHNPDFIFEISENEKTEIIKMLLTDLEKGDIEIAD